MSKVRITVGKDLKFTAVFEDKNAPQTVAAFKKLMPYKQRIVHCRWSGEGCWIPLGEFKLDVGFENHTSYPAPGQILWYPGGYSETELIFAYGPVSFASKMGQLAGNHFLTIVEGNDRLQDMGKKVLYEGAQEIVFE